MELNNYIGNKIRYFREENGFSQEKLANLLHTSRQTISRYENGDRKASQDVLYELAQLFDKSMDDFFPPREVEMPNKNSLTIAAHIDDDVTEEELRDILAYIEMKKRLHRGK